jgi:enamine deaminase RidA (YjgF/YER057c/UK114 family)
MSSVNIIRYNPIGIFSGTTQTVITYDDKSVVHHVEPSGNVGSQYPKELAAQWLGTIQNLAKGLVKGGATWGDVYATDVLWTTPAGGRAACDAYKNDYNAVYGALIDAVTKQQLKSNRMARFTHPEGFPDPEALFEVQIKAVRGEAVSVGGGVIDYGNWQDYQPSGASVQHKGADGKTITTLGTDLKKEMEYVLIEQYEKPMAEKGVDFKTQTLWLEVLVAVDSDPSSQWARVAAMNEVIADYFGYNRPAGATYPVSWIPNLDGVVEPQPRCVVGEDITIERSGDNVDGFSTWTSFTHSGVKEVMTSGVGGDDAGTMLGTIDGYIKAAGGAGLKEDGIFNNAYVVAKDSSEASREWIVEFNKSFTAYYEGTSPAGRTAQFVGGYMDQKYPCGISNRAIFAV